MPDNAIAIEKIKKYLLDRETLIWYRASHQERERLLDFGLVDKSQYVTLLRQLRKKYAI
ncbi:TPA: hypothetical protein VEV74_000758 [Streptococcus pyogenes]|nr:hypothetical protein [Streptococcus pyogenes]HEQ2432027.1 hypothetical protein [Streptococcus pyogenes]